MLYLISLIFSYVTYKMIHEKLFINRTFDWKNAIRNVVVAGCVSIVVVYLLTDSIFNYKYAEEYLFGLLNIFNSDYKEISFDLNLIYYIVFVGIKEELSKYLAVFLIIKYFNNGTLRTQRQMLLLFVEVGIGFGIIENYNYVDTIYVSIIRGIYMVGLHALLSLSVGLMIIYLNKNMEFSKIWSIIISIIFIGFLHGMYDLLVTMVTNVSVVLILGYYILIVYLFFQLNPKNLIYDKDSI